MPSHDDLVTLLSGIHVSDRYKRRAAIVAGHLVSYVLKERGNSLSKLQRQKLISPSANRLWDNYRGKRRQPGQSPKEVAEETIAEELDYLETILTDSN